MNKPYLIVWLRYTISLYSLQLRIALKLDYSVIYSITIHIVIILYLTQVTYDCMEYSYVHGALPYF